jgi:hypothetical protein
LYSTLMLCFSLLFLYFCMLSLLDYFFVSIVHIVNIKGIVSKLTIKFWMCQKCGKMKDYNKKWLQVL